MSKSMLIENVEVWNPRSLQRGVSILVKNGVVAEILPAEKLGLKEAGNVDEHLKGHSGSVVLPSGVDEQVHLRTPGQAQKETPETALAAAVAGGVGAVLTMPNTKPPIDDVQVLNLGRAEVQTAESQYGVKVLFTACLTKAMQGQEAVDFEALMKAGVTHFTDDGIGVASQELMDEIFAKSAALGFTILQHAEVPGHGGVLAPGPIQRAENLNPYFEDAEVDMVRRDIELLRKHKKARYHVLHVSSKKTLELVRRAKDEGLLITCEATPHHLLLTVDDIESGQTAYKMNPPLRNEEDRQALIEGLQSGLVDFMATDHAPHETAMKGSDFRRSAFGTTGLETALRSLLQLRLEERLSPERLVQVFSTTPAGFLGIDNEFGEIAKGRPFRAVWIEDLKQGRSIEVSDLKSLSKNNCFLGHKLPGRVHRFFGKG